MNKRNLVIIDLSFMVGVLRLWSLLSDGLEDQGERNYMAQPSALWYSLGVAREVHQADEHQA